MKKILLCLAMAFSAMISAQETPKETEKRTTRQDFKVNENLGKNELKLNTILLILGAFEVSYERVLTDESSAGISVGGSFDKETINYNYSIEPYYRYFFGRKPAAGFFIEGFGSINSRDYRTFKYEYSGISTYTDVRKTHLGVGVGVGGKFVTSNNIVFEITGGFGRNLTARGNNDYNENGIDQKIAPRFGISAGYRF